ncbi:hypothetical protein D0Z07_6089 [Hyphodiscus hymeniophilus]|uniref:Uncharacterized protein n=1 Tax=Hyphodiscus hymeniophilus TaxID=353542 RepID=A0A9P7AUN8_9HELO|nr:hypothetical protein D0Z07_6089 [Hyphodiscus hymeniophilus]
MMRVIALHYVLYHDIKVTPDDSVPADDWRILRAQIDTKLFKCLFRAEKLVYQALNKLIFLSAGRLTRDAIFPVCLTMWLLVRLQCLRASFLTNLRPKSSSGNHRSKLRIRHHQFNLLLTTFKTLFRASMPLLLNFDDSLNRDLLGDDAELLAMATKLKGSLVWFKKFGYVKLHRKSMGYSKSHATKIQELINGM